ncbi:MAG: hypothetical protein BWY69_01184 [Planctomycetes bacterium ADurb.Bin401]|nr:MAG: hypothetical protein BWY69_01184 [Planctomycetes bacterium ADurb.Bin401]
MIESTENNDSVTNDCNLNLFATLSIFVAKAPGLMDCMNDSLAAQNITELEEYAAKLITLSNNADLEGFSERIKYLIIAAREKRLQEAVQQLESLKECFHKMTRMVSEAV